MTTFATAPALAVAGQRADTGIDNIVLSRKNVGVAQVTTVTIVSENNSTLYTITINGVAIGYTSDASGTFAEINAGLLAAIAAETALAVSGVVTAVQGATTGTIVITAVSEDVAFTCTVTATILTVALTTSSAGAIPFGLVVAGNGADKCKLPTVTGDLMLGIAIQTLTMTSTNAGATEYPQDNVVGVLSKGRIWVTAEGTVTAGGAVYVRFATGAGGSQKGALRADADTATAVLLAGAKFVGAATTGNIVEVAINLP